jgi:lipoprotein-anchoring transpeptidase ErfK/SrfK
MVDYFPVLNRAVGALDPNTPETRRGVYDRARRALVDGLRSSDPALSDSDLRTQSAALEDAIRQVESQYEVDALRGVQPPDAPRRMPPPAAALRTPPPMLARAAPAAAPAAPTSEPESTPEAQDVPEDRYQDRPPLGDERKPYRMIAAGVAALAVLLGAAAAYTYWPSKTGVPPTQRATATATKRVDAGPVGAGGAGYVYLRQPVYYRTNHPVGTIVVDKSQSFLYVVRPSVSAVRYGISVGPECNATAGLYQIVRKEEWPGFKVPSSGKVADDERNKNPFGARALYLSKESRIHGTNAPSSIGRPSSLGCIRLTNDDVVYLYDRSPLETRVVVLN